MKGFKSNRQWLIFISLLTVIASVFFLISCGSDGADSYKKPGSSYFADENTLITVDTLKKWYENGMKTEDGNPVLVVEMEASDYDKAPDNRSDYIPGSVSITSAELQATRSDGPVFNDSMIASGSQMDGVLSKYGITKDTVIVFTGKQPSYAPERAWWTFYYWGFSKKNIKLLDGGTPLWYKKKYPMTTDIKKVTPSSFKIQDLPYDSERVKRIDEARVPIGKMIEYVQNGNAFIIATVPGTGFGFFNGKIKGALRVHTVSAASFLYNSDGTYKSADNLTKAFDDIDNITGNFPTDKNARIIVYCNRANLASQYYYPLKEIMGYKNVAIYDGSWSEWSGLLAQHPDNATLTNAGGLITFDNILGKFVYMATNQEVTLTNGGTVQEGKYNVLKYTEEIQFRPGISDNQTQIDNYMATYSVDPYYDGPGNLINEEDKKYILYPSGSGGSGGSTGGGGSKGGC